MEFGLEVLLSPHMWEVLTCHMPFQCFKGICSSHHTRFVSYQLDSLLLTCRSRFSCWTLMFDCIVCVRPGRPPPFWCAVLTAEIDSVFTSGKYYKALRVSMWLIRGQTVTNEDFSE